MSLFQPPASAAVAPASSPTPEQVAAQPVANMAPPAGLSMLGNLAVPSIAELEASVATPTAPPAAIPFGAPAKDKIPVVVETGFDAPFVSTAAPQQFPLFALIYGPIGIGKTADICSAFPNGFVFGLPGATKSVQAIYGFMPDQFDVPTIQNITAAVPHIVAARKYDAILVDDFTVYIARTVRDLEGKMKDGRQIYGVLNKIVNDFRDTCRVCGLHVVINCWLKGPELLETGVLKAGGPALPGRLGETLPGLCDLVLRAEVDETKPWHKACYHARGNKSFVGKDRDNGTPDNAPMNLGEICRFNGYPMHRRPGTEWLDTVAEQIAVALYAAGPSKDAEIIEDWQRKLYNAMPEHYYLGKWAVRDGYHRVVLRRAEMARRCNFSDFVVPAAKGALNPFGR